MTTLEDKAETPENVAHSISDAAEAAGEYKVRSLELDPADEVGSGQFPQYGDWLPCSSISPDGLDIGEVWVECPRGLAQALLEAELEEGDRFRVVSAEKSPAGEWHVEIDAAD